MKYVQNVCVFCGASKGYDEIYMDIAKEFGELLAHNGMGLVYGGGGNGLMGAVAKAALNAGGKPFGITTDFLTSWSPFCPALPIDNQNEHA